MDKDSQKCEMCTRLADCLKHCRRSLTYLSTSSPSLSLSIHVHHCFIRIPIVRLSEQTALKADCKRIFIAILMYNVFCLDPPLPFDSPPFCSQIWNEGDLVNPCNRTSLTKSSFQLVDDVARSWCKNMLNTELCLSVRRKISVEIQNLQGGGGWAHGLNLLARVRPRNCHFCEALSSSSTCLRADPPASSTLGFYQMLITSKIVLKELPSHPPINMKYHGTLSGLALCSTILYHIQNSVQGTFHIPIHKHEVP